MLLEEPFWAQRSSDPAERRMPGGSSAGLSTIALIPPTLGLESGPRASGAAFTKVWELTGFQLGPGRSTRL